LKTDTANCGGCGQACPTSPFGLQPGCQNGECECTAGGNLEGNGNYILFNNCSSIPGLTVTFTASEDINAAACPYNNGSSTPVAGSCTANGGFSMQLNASPPPNSQFSFMQYVLEVSGDTVGFQIQYWCTINSCTNNACCHPGSPCSCANPVFNPYPIAATILNLSSTTLKQDSVLEIKLNTNPNGNVTSVTFIATSPDTPNNPPQTVQIPAAFQAPISAFDVVFVGPNNSQISDFSSGAGSLQYSVSNGKLCVQGAGTCNGQSLGTAENSNATYSTLAPSCCGSTLAQYVGT
jgi:hypothetical protein